jgi:hypothetical protein
LVLADLQAAIAHLPHSAYEVEARPLLEQLQKIQATRRGPQLLGDILPIVLARLGSAQLQSTEPGIRTSASSSGPTNRQRFEPQGLSAFI